MHKRIPQLLMVTGSLLLLLSSGIKVYSLVEDYLAGHRAKLVLEQAREVLSSVPRFTDPDPAALVDEVKSDSVPAESNVPIPTDPVLRQPDYDTVGVLTITQLGLELPILSECTGSLLKVSVCKYQGAAQDKPERLIVAGHNYKSHFGNLAKLTLGSKVRFTNHDGIEYSYTVAEITEIFGNDHQTLGRGEWDITLFTCNSDGSRRILVRCQEEQFR